MLWHVFNFYKSITQRYSVSNNQLEVETLIDLLRTMAYNWQLIECNCGKCHHNFSSKDYILIIKNFKHPIDNSLVFFIFVFLSHYIINQINHLSFLLQRFEKFYLDREIQMIKGEKRYCTKLLSLLWITEFAINGFKVLKLSKLRIQSSL